MASFRMQQLLRQRHKTSQLCITNIKENVCGCDINCPTFTIIALILDESQRECLKSLYRSQWTRLNLLWVEASGTNPFFSLGVAESRHQNRRLSPGLWRWKLLREWTLPGWIGRMPWCKISHALLSRISPSWGEDEWNLFKKSISTQAASLSHLAYYYL